MTHFFPNKTAWQFCQQKIDEMVVKYDLAWGNVMSLDPVNQRLIFVASSDDTAKHISHKVVECERSLAGLAVDARELVWVDDIKAHRTDGREFYHKTLIERFNLTILCSIPILNSFNNHQDLLVLNLFPKRTLNNGDRDKLNARWRIEARELGEWFERCLEQESQRAVNRLNATLGSQPERPTLRSVCRLFAKVVKEKIECDFVSIFTQPPKRDEIELQGWVDDSTPLQTHFFELLKLAQQVHTRNREELHLFHTDLKEWDLPCIDNKQMSVLLVPIRTPEGAPLGVILAANFSISITTEPMPLTYEHVAVAESMAQTFAPRIELMYSEEKKAIAMSRLGHEMRTPVSAFRAALERIAEEMVQRNIQFKRDYVSDLQSYARIMQWNVRDLDLVRGAIDRIQVNANAVFLESEVIQPAKNHVYAECRRRRLSANQIEVIPFKYVIPALHIDKDLMTHVVFNLLENSIKYAKDDPSLFSVRIIPKWRADGDYEIWFIDNGRGVPIGFEDKIFQESYRHVSVWHIPGDGIGLAVAQKLVEVHGGTLTCIPSEVGAKFVIRLPKKLRYSSPASFSMHEIGV